MPCELVKTVINDREYSTLQLDPTKALKLETRLYPILVGGLAPLAATWGKGDTTQLEAIQQATRCLVEQMPPDEMAKLIVELCQMANFDGKRIEFDSHFSQVEDPTERYRVAMFVLGANFGGFIDALSLSGVADKAREAMVDSIPGMNQTLQ